MKRFLQGLVVGAVAATSVFSKPVTRTSAAPHRWMIQRQRTVLSRAMDAVWGFSVAVLWMLSTSAPSFQKAQASMATAAVAALEGVSSAAITFASAVVPLAAQTDAYQICYNRNHTTNTWTASGIVCPVLDPTVVSGFAQVPCQSLETGISAPSGAVLTDLKAKFKLLVQLTPGGACGAAAVCPSAD